MSRAYMIPPALLLLLPLFPPETRGESLAGCAALIGFCAALTWWRQLDSAGLLPVVLSASAIFPLGLIAQAPGAVMEPLATAVLALAAGLCAACVPKDSRGGALVPLLLALVAALVALHACYQKLWGLENLISSLAIAGPVADGQLLIERASSGRAFAAFPTPAALGGYLVMTLPITLFGAVARRGKARWLLLVLALLQGLGLLASASFTAVAALFAVLALAALSRKTTRGRALLGLLAVALILLAVVATRGREILDPADRRSPWRLRAANFATAAQMVSDHPWGGVGLGGFGEAYPRYRGAGDNETQHVHDLPLEMAAELGLPGGVLVAGAFFYVFLGPLLRRTAESVGWWYGVELGLAAFALHNLTDFTAYLPSLLWTAALLRGWIARRDAPPRPSVPATPVILATAATLAAATVAGLSGLAWNDRGAARQAAIEARHADAAALASRAVRRAPWNVDGRLLEVQAELRARGTDAFRLEEALRELDGIVALAPVRPAARHLRSRVRLALGDLPGAYADAMEACRLYPRSEAYLAARDDLAARFVGTEPTRGAW